MYQQGTKSKCKVITLANQKGGTAKTITTVNLGIGLVNQGHKVLLVRSKDYYYLIYKQLLEEIGLPYICFHDL